ncbi:unnamed protein product [Cylicocyclus nassatus]|uniref:Uncharacterized protein n=1 Tax=Cylicocyclus nassatus TaxID=53992 RepID=A0AA36MC05_CYLNA|nr:unnamed protein product [Cylicocyclus nassatus]
MDSFEISVHFSDSPLTTEDREVLRVAEEAKNKDDKKLFVLEWLSQNEATWKNSTERVAHYRRKARIEMEKKAKSINEQSRKDCNGSNGDEKQ